MDYNATATLDRTFEQMGEGETDAILDELIDYHPAIAAGPTGEAEIIITLPAENLRQATQTATALLAPYEPIGTEVITTAMFDKRLGLEPVPELLSVAQVAAKLNLTRQAILQRVRAGSIPAHKIGSTWAIPAAAVA